jgi:hypothetical protein
MALPLAKQLNVPLFTQVFDPLPWWMKAHGIDAWHTRSILAQFGRTITASKACATASRSMADAYLDRYGAPCVPLIASHPCEPSSDACRSARARAQSSGRANHSNGGSILRRRGMEQSYKES